MAALLSVVDAAIKPSLFCVFTRSGTSREGEEHAVAAPHTLRRPPFPRHRPQALAGVDVPERTTLAKLAQPRHIRPPDIDMPAVFVRIGMR